jgi:hypothetical protein
MAHSVIFKMAAATILELRYSPHFWFLLVVHVTFVSCFKFGRNWLVSGRDMAYKVNFNMTAAAIFTLSCNFRFCIFSDLNETFSPFFNFNQNRSIFATVIADFVSSVWPPISWIAFSASGSVAVVPRLFFLQILKVLSKLAFPY